MKTCLLITVYKNRFDSLIRWLDSDDSWINKYLDIFLLIQNNDSSKNEYDKLLKSDTTIKKIYCDATNICEKRKYGYHWAIDNDYDMLIWSDDDISPVCSYIDFKTRTPTGRSFKQMHYEIDNLYKKLIDMRDIYPDGGIYTTIRSGYMGFLQKKVDILVDTKICPIQLIAINLKNTKDKVDYPDSDKEYFEDQAFAIETLVNGMHIYGLPNHTYASTAMYNWKKNTITTVFSDNEGGKYKFERFLIGQYVKFGGDLKINNKGQLTPRLKYSKYYAERKYPIPFGKEFDPELRRICCEGKVTNDTVDKVYEYLNKKKENA